MKKKRWLSYFIVLAIILTIMPRPVSAEGEIIEKSLDDGNVEITSEGTYRISQTNYENTSTENTIYVNVDNGDVYIILNGINIDVSSTQKVCAFKIKDNSQANVTVELKEGTTNILKSGVECAGLQKNGDRQGVGTLTITGTGSLEAIGGELGAGIGGESGDPFETLNVSNIIISSGTITATGGANAGAGIGGGWLGSGSNIKINGGTVTAIGGAGLNGANGIGNGAEVVTSSNNIIITGGSVKAVGGKNVSTFSADPIDENGNRVYLIKLENQENVKTVSVDGKVFTNQGNHPNDSTFYLYLTGKDHTIVSGANYYKASWNSDNSTFSIENKAPTPTFTTSETASSITLNLTNYDSKYGTIKYKINTETNWQESTDSSITFSNLKANSTHAIEVQYAGITNSYIASEVAKRENVTTNQASYTISIPSTTLTAGNSSSTSTISVNTNQNFDLGYNGHVDVKVIKNENEENVTDDAKLKLKRQGDSTTIITSALLVNGSALGNINKNVATFKSINDKGVSISFAKPTESNIPAGTYQGTITFEVSYSEQ